MNDICKNIPQEKKRQGYLAWLAARVARQQNGLPAEETENLAEGQKIIPLNKGRFAIVDESDFNELSKFNWQVTTSGKNGKPYAKRHSYNIETGKDKTIKMHRQILNVTDGKVHVDHINGNGLDNRRCNLRAVTQAENNRAHKRKKTGSSSIYRGVFKNAGYVGFSARIVLNNVKYNLGSFKTEIEAAIAYDKKAIELGFVSQVLNFPEKSK